MSIALVASVKSGTNSGGTTSAGVDTSGADGIEMVVGHYGAAADPTISDSKGNTWTKITSYTEAAFTRVTKYYAKNATVGSGHTFSATGANCFAGIAVGAFSGTDTSAFFDAGIETGSNGNAGTSNPGSITPSEANCLVTVGANVYPDGVASIDSGYTIAENLIPSAGNYFGAMLAYKVQTTATATNPTVTHNVVNQYADAIASFKAAGAATGNLILSHMGGIQGRSALTGGIRG